MFNQAAEASPGSTFTWKISNFSKLTTEILHSDTFSVGGNKWRIYLNPKGKGSNKGYLSLFLAVADSAYLPDGWTKLERFSLVLVNQTNHAHSLTRVTRRQFEFKAGRSVLGWSKFIWLNKLHSRGFLVEDTCMVKAEIKQDQKKEELGLSVKEEWEKAEVRIEEDNGSKESDVVEPEEELEEGGGEHSQTESIERDQNTQNYKRKWKDNDGDNLLAKCLSRKRGEGKGEGEVEVTKGEEKSEIYWKPRLRNAKSMRTENKVDSNEAKSSDSVNPIGLKQHIFSTQEPSRILLRKSNGQVQSQTPLETFAALFEDISSVVGPLSCSSVSTGEADVGTEAVEISLSLSLLKHVAKKPFCRIPCSIWPELASALVVLAQAKTLPSAVSSVISNLSSRFGNLCKSYDANIALLDTAQQFFDTKDSVFVSLKRLNKSQLEIKNSADRIRREKDKLRSRLAELDDSVRLLLEDYTSVGTKAAGVKTEWDGVIAMEAEMTSLREGAEKDMAAIECTWTNFISHFK